MIMQGRSLEDEIDAYYPYSDELQSAFSNLFYPVGTIYMSYDSTSPASLFGGTWVQIKDRFLIGAGNTYTAGTLGGSDTLGIQHHHSVTYMRAKIGSKTGYPNTLAYVAMQCRDPVTGATENADSVYRADNFTSQPTFSHFTLVDGVVDDYRSDQLDKRPPYRHMFMWRRTAI